VIIDKAHPVIVIYKLYFSNNRQPR